MRNFTNYFTGKEFPSFMIAKWRPADLQNLKGH